ncbi:MAG: hypothetical protein J5771_06460 [Bacteroidales bacterium]|nr:hypothetical protein [Bacteroidales bacterium]
MKLAAIILATLLDIVPMGKAFLQPLQKRDSIVIADQVEYCFELDAAAAGKSLALPTWEKLSGDTLAVVRDWKLDTLKAGKKAPARYRGSVVIAPFEEGTYNLPDVYVLRSDGKTIDTLKFDACTLEVKDVLADTTGFKVRDIKAQMRYPVTFREALPYILGGLLAAGVIALGVLLIIRYRRRKAGLLAPKDPPHIVALRELDRYRSDKYWAPEKQKAFYSGVTDTLKAYIDARFGVDAPEMTTAELFAALADIRDISPELKADLQEMFERADFVKFAKYIAPDGDNAKVLPLSVRFVTDTYQATLEEERKDDAV